MSGVAVTNYKYGFPNGVTASDSNTRHSRGFKREGGAFTISENRGTSLVRVDWGRGVLARGRWNKRGNVTGEGRGG